MLQFILNLEAVYRQILISEEFSLFPQLTPTQKGILYFCIICHII